MDEIRQRVDAEAELAALKARIADAPLVPMTAIALGNGYSLSVSASMSVNDVDAMKGKRVRLLVDEPPAPPEPGSLDELRIERGGHK